MILGPALVTGAVPILLSDFVLSQHALSSGRVETRSMAERTLERTETVVTEGLAVLGELKMAGHVSCSIEDRNAFGLKAFGSRYIQQIGIVDSAGTLLCGEPMGALAEPARLPMSERGDPSVMIGILLGKDDRQAVVTLRVADTLRLVARFSRSSVETDVGPEFLTSVSSVAIYLEDGSQWLLPTGEWVGAGGQDAIVESASSTRYPVKVVAAASAEAARATIAPLKSIVVILSTVGALIVFAFSLWKAWHREDGDIFSRAVENQEFIPYYQPVIDIFTGEVKGGELLVRWQRPDGSMVPPGQFLPYAEATGLIRDITRQLMARAVEDCADIFRMHPTLKLSINLTAMHFKDLEIIEEIKEIFGDSSIRFEQLCFEITEQNPLKDLNLSRAIIGRIQALGAAVALDDVGTGHSGLAYLQKLGVDIIKIDKMFVDNIDTDHSSQTIVDTLIELSTQLGLGVIAEGVEREEQAEYLRSIGIATAQGYLYSPPVPAAVFLEAIAKSVTPVAVTPIAVTSEANTEAEDILFDDKQNAA
jgi:sensor c-di-GMP phosphodiesterase-like protein